MTDDQIKRIADAVHDRLMNGPIKKLQGSVEWGGMTRRQIVVGDGKQGPPYPEDLYPDARISNRHLLAAIRDLQAKMPEGLGDAEKRITDKADKAHAQIGKRIDSLAEQIGTVAEAVSTIDSKIDTPTRLDETP